MLVSNERIFLSDTQEDGHTKTIPYKAPASYKQTAFRFYISKALNVCSQEYINEKLNIIRKIDKDGRFHQKIVKREIWKQITYRIKVKLNTRTLQCRVLPRIHRNSEKVVLKAQKW